MIADQKLKLEELTKHFMYHLTINLRCWDILSQTNIWALSCIYTLHEALLVTDTKCTDTGQSTYTIFTGGQGCVEKGMKGHQATCIFCTWSSGNALGTFTLLFHSILTILWDREYNSFPFYKSCLNFVNGGNGIRTKIWWQSQATFLYEDLQVSTIY